MNPLFRASIELEHPFAFGAFFCAVFALGSSCSSDPGPSMDLGTGGMNLGAGAANQGTGANSSQSGGATSSGGEQAGSGAQTGSGATDAGSGAQTGTGGDSTSSEEVSKSSGCEAAMPLVEGEHTFTLAGKDRRYIVRLPQNYVADKPLPLVLALHPNGSGAGYWDSENTSGSLAAREFYKDKAILVVTQAIGGNWRDYGQAEDTWDARVEEELSYFDQLLDETKSGLCIDENKIYSIGFSGGGSFSGVLGCRRDDIRGFAAGGAVIYFKPGDCIQNPAAWVTIGDGEQSDLRSEFRDYFRDAAGCQTTSTPGTPVTCESYETCGVNTPVTFCSHAGGHEVPDFFLASSWDLFKSLAP